MQWKRLPLGPLNTNCYILCCDETNRALVIDPGAAEAPLSQALKDVEGVTIVATHGHWDHMSGVPYLQRECGAQFLLHYAELECLRVWAKERNLAIKPNDFLGEGDCIEAGSICLKVLHMPGHSPGHLVLMEERNRWLFTGDLLLKGSTGGANVPGGNPADFIASMRRLRDLESDWVIYPGHMEESSMEWERKHNPYIKYNLKDVKTGDPGAT